MLQNPLSLRARGIIYISSIVTGGVCLVATAVLTTMGAEAWIAVPSVLASAVASTAGVLARDNLTSLSSPEEEGTNV